MIRVFLQSRLGSTRLPGKALLPLAGLTLTDHALKALRGVGEAQPLVLTDEASAPALREVCTRQGWGLMVGPAEDVLARYVAGLDSVGARDEDLVIRATGDNPLVSTQQARDLAAWVLGAGLDYGAWDGAPLGTGVEAVRAGVLRQAHRDAGDAYEREHVTPYVYRHPELFDQERRSVPARWKNDGRVTVDTHEDYDYITSLFEALYTGRSLTTEELIPWLVAHPHPRR